MSQWDPDDDDLVDELPAPPRKQIPAADRELLELAARALGAVRVEDVDGEEWLILHFADGTEAHGWNPLLFYSDTFELAVKLELDVKPFGQWDEGNPSAVAFQGGDIFASVAHGPDAVAATARAVVRAAAEIGKAGQ